MNSQPSGPSAFGPFRLDSTLGSNGLLFTFGAEHRANRFPVVITAVEAREVERAARERFEIEAGRLAGRTYAQLLPPIQWGVEEGWLWCASNRVPGEHIGSLMRTSGVPPAALSLELLRQAFLALEECGRQDICHGGLSPASILVDTASHVSVLHVPWCRILMGIPNRYLHPALMSILPFTAPEVAASGEPSPQGDAYSLGSILYYLLTGQPAHWADEPQALLEALQSTTPDLEPVHSIIPASAVDLIEELLAHDPRDRPINWPALARRLEAIVREMGAAETDYFQTAAEEVEAQTQPEQSPVESWETMYGSRKTTDEELPTPTLQKPASAYLAPAPPPPPRMTARDEFVSAPELDTQGEGESPDVAESDEPPRHPAQILTGESTTKRPSTPLPESQAAEVVISTGASPQKVLLVILAGVLFLVLAAGGFLAYSTFFMEKKPAPVATPGAAPSVDTLPVDRINEDPNKIAPGKDIEYTQTARTILTIGRFVQTFKKLRNQYPASIQDLGLGPVKSNDFWGTPLEIRDGFVISAGRDKKWDTKDDLYFDPEMGILGGAIEGVDMPAELLSAPEAPPQTEDEKKK